jgi:ankyrin repeat protein
MKRSDGDDPETLTPISAADALVFAAMTSDGPGMESLLRSYEDFQDLTFKSALLWTARRGAYRLLEMLLLSSASCNTYSRYDAANTTCCNDGWSVLMEAASEASDDHTEVVRLLLKHGAEVNDVTNDDGTNALIAAAFSGNHETVRLLLAAGADPTRGKWVISLRFSGGLTPLHCAATNGDTEMVCILLDHTPRLHAIAASDGHTPLMEACYHGHFETAELLVDRKSDPNAATHVDGHTALMTAAEGAHFNVVVLLLVYNADPKSLDIDGRNAQIYAIDGESDKPSVAPFLAAVEDMSAFEIAVVCRLHERVMKMLHCGATLPTHGALKVAIATKADELWPGAKAPCADTTRLVNAAMQCWSPERHILFHCKVRQSVKTLLLVAIRHQNRVGTLPNELWLVLCSFFLRSDWGV